MPKKPGPTIRRRGTIRGSKHWNRRNTFLDDLELLASEGELATRRDDKRADARSGRWFHVKSGSVLGWFVLRTSTLEMALAKALAELKELKESTEGRTEGGVILPKTTTVQAANQGRS